MTTELSTSRLAAAPTVNAAEPQGFALGEASLSALGHEIRGPLALVRDLAARLETGSDEKDRRRLAALLRLATEQALAVADDLVTDGALAANRFELRPERLDPVALAEGVASLYAPVLAGEGRAIAVIARTDAPRETVTDPVRLRQVLINLVTNAVRSSDRSSVAIEVGGTPARVEFAVLDDGPGLPEGFAVEPYRKGAGSPGAGLGLFIAGRLVEALGGELAFSANRPRGTSARFSVRRLIGLARRAAAHLGEEGEGSGEASAGPPLFALVVDDSEVARQLMESMLASFDIETATAGNAAEAARRFAEIRPDLIVLDWTLGRESGADVLDRLAAEGPLPPVIVATARRNLAVDARVAAVLVKPFSPRELYDTIARLSHREESGIHAS